MYEEHERRPTRRTRQHRVREERRMRPRLLLTYVSVIAVLHVKMNFTRRMCCVCAVVFSLSRKEPKTTKDEIRLTGTDGVVNQQQRDFNPFVNLPDQQRDSTPLLPRSTKQSSPYISLCCKLFAPGAHRSFVGGASNMPFFWWSFLGHVATLWFFATQQRRKHHSSLVERVTIIHSRTSRVESSAILTDRTSYPPRRERKAKQGGEAAAAAAVPR